MEKKYDLVAVGEVLIDMTETGKTEAGSSVFAANPGGAPANVAVAASKLGAKAAFIGRTGPDPLGEGLREVLEANGVDVSGMSVDKAVPTTIAMVSLDENGERDFTFLRNPGADITLSPEHLPREMIESAKILHFGSVSLTAEPERSATLAAVEIAKQAGNLISYDPNYRPPLWPDEKTAVAEMKAAVPLCDILKVSDEEMVLLSGSGNLSQGSAALTEMGPFLVLITLGADGVFYRMGASTGHISGRQVTVADTNGAGDTFFGAVLCELAKLPDPEEVTVPELEKILRFANYAASVTTSRSGAIPAMPGRQEVEELLAEAGK